MRALLYLRELVKQERTRHYLESLKLTEKLSTEELRKNQFEKLQELLKYLSINNPFYSQYLQKNSIKLAEDWKYNPYNLLSKLPITDKLFIGEHIHEWLTTNKDYTKLAKQFTSGSTGTPFIFFSSQMNSDIKMACKGRLLNWHGVKRGEKQFCYMGVRSPYKKSSVSSLKIQLNYKYVWNRFNFDSKKINIAKEIERINKEKPVTIYGYPSTIFEISQYAIQHNLKINNNKLKMIILSGESHSPYMKEIIHQAFNIYPDDEYCSSEGFLAGTCKNHKLHLNEDTLIAEVLNENGEISEYGKGELLVTYLYSGDFPFIRYNIGDIVEISAEKCLCGRNLKVLKSVDGRKGAYIYNGQSKITDAAISIYIATTIFIDKIAKYQIVQNDLSSVLFKLVVTDKNRHYKDFELHMKQMLYNLDVNFEYVDDIPKENSGKYRSIINNVK